MATWHTASPVRYAKFESIRYFIDIDILQNCLIDIDIDIFQNHHIDIDIDIDIFGIALSISISIFSKMTISILISISIFFKSVDISTIDMSYRYIEQGYTLTIITDPIITTLIPTASIIIMSSVTLFPSVNSVLEAFKRAREKMAAAKEGLEQPVSKFGKEE